MARYAVLLVVAALACSQLAQGRELMQAATAGTAAQVQFFDDQFEGGSQMFPVTVPATGCSTCAELNYVRTNSWESFLSSFGTSIQLFDSHGCTGTTMTMPARSGVIQGSLANSVDSFKLCA